MAETGEIYKHFSHFNFTPERWREAAERYLSLESNLAQAESEDEEIDHDELGERFMRCDICEHISELQDMRDEFAKEFAGVWAKKAIEREAGDV